MSFGFTEAIKIIEKMKELKARYVFFVWVFGALLTFLPLTVKQQLQVTIPEGIQPWIGFTTLGAFVLWLVMVLLNLVGFIQNKLRNREIKAMALKQLKTLSHGEREIFLLCLHENKRTIHREITDPPINSLQSKQLIVRAREGNILAMPFTIPDFVWSHIKINEEELFPELSDVQAMKRLLQAQQHSWMRR